MRRTSSLANYTVIVVNLRCSVVETQTLPPLQTYHNKPQKMVRVRLTLSPLQIPLHLPSPAQEIMTTKTRPWKVRASTLAPQLTPQA